MCMGYGIAGGKTSPKRLRQQGIQFLLIAVMLNMCLRISETHLYAFLMRISASIMPYYLLQWVFVAIEMTILLLCRMPEGSFSVLWYLLSVIVIIAACTALSLTCGMRIMKPLLRITSPRRPNARKAKRA